MPGTWWPLPAPQRDDRSSALTEPSDQWTDGSPLELPDPGHELGETEKAPCGTEYSLDSDFREKQRGTAH